MGPKIRPNRIFWTFLEHRPCRNRFWTPSENGSKILAKREQNPLKLAPKIVNFKKKEIFLRLQNARFWASKSVQIAFFGHFRNFRKFEIFEKFVLITRYENFYTALSIQKFPKIKKIQ